MRVLILMFMLTGCIDENIIKDRPDTCSCNCEITIEDGSWQ